MLTPLEVARTRLMSLEERDFDLTYPDARGLEQLHEICDNLAGHAAHMIGPIIFAFIEKFADPVKIDARFDLGTPGPLVHTLEACPGYEVFLLESLRRRPAPLSVWMLNRILNVLPSGEGYDRYLALLRSVCDRVDVSAATRTEAAEFLEHQWKSRNA
jgi:hypothetical protein